MMNYSSEQTRLSSFFPNNKRNQCDTVKKRQRPFIEEQAAERKDTLMPGQNTPFRVTRTQSTPMTSEEQPASSEDRIDAMLSGPPLSEKYRYLLSQSIGLPLPYHYKTLYSLFSRTDSTLSYAQLRKIEPLFASIKEAVEAVSKHVLTESHLSQFLHVVPEVYVLRWLSSHLYLDFPMQQQMLARAVPKSELAARKHNFYDSLLQITKHWHAEYLKSLRNVCLPTLSISTTWHSGFKLHECPAIPEAPLLAKPQIDRSTDQFPSQSGGQCDVLVSKTGTQPNASLPGDREMQGKQMRALRLIALSDLLRTIYERQRSPSLFLKHLVKKVAGTQQFASDKAVIEKDVLELVQVFHEWLGQVCTNSGPVIRMNNSCGLSREAVVDAIHQRYI